MTREQILDCLRGVTPDADFDTLDPARTFHDQYDIDSVDYLNFVLALEERSGGRIDESDFPRLASLEGCLAYFASREGATEALRFSAKT